MNEIFNTLIFSEIQFCCSGAFRVGRRSTWMQTIAVLLFLISWLPLLGKELPNGLLITKTTPTDTKVGSVFEYQKVTEHLVPATDYVTVTKANGEQDDIPKNLILLKVEYPKELSRNIVTPAALAGITALLQPLQTVVIKYPQTQNYLNPKIAMLQKEVDLFNLGSRKINGTWISSTEYNRLVAEDQARKAAMIEAKNRAEAEAAATRQREEAAKVEAQRLADEKVAADEKREADEKNALEEQRKADLLLQKKKLAATIPVKKPPTNSSMTWILGAASLLIGAGAFAWIRKWEGLPAKPAKPGLESLDWPSFELLVAEIYRRKGYQIEISSGFGSAGGRDLLFKQGTEIILVECKHWKAVKNYKISAPEITNLYQWVMSEPGQKGVFITTGDYMEDAKEFVVGKPIQLMGLAEIKKLMSSVTRKGENLLDINTWVGDFIPNATIVDPKCPICHKAMLLKTARDGTPIWNCLDPTSCLGKMDARVNLVKHRL